MVNTPLWSDSWSPQWVKCRLIRTFLRQQSHKLLSPCNSLHKSRIRMAQASEAALLICFVSLAPLSLTICCYWRHFELHKFMKGSHWLGEHLLLDYDWIMIIMHDRSLESLDLVEFAMSLTYHFPVGNLRGTLRLYDGDLGLGSQPNVTVQVSLGHSVQVCLSANCERLPDSTGVANDVLVHLVHSYLNRSKPRRLVSNCFVQPRERAKSCTYRVLLYIFLELIFNFPRLSLISTPSPYVTTSRSRPSTFEAFPSRPEPELVSRGACCVGRCRAYHPTGRQR